MRKLMIRFSKTGDFPEIDYYFKTVVRRAILKTLEYEEFPYDAEVSVTLCNNEYIRRLNKKYRNIDKSTDVLSFPMYDFSEEEIDEDPVILGDIVISVEHAVAQGELYGHGLRREIAYLTVHSMLHLLGYDHVNGGMEEVRMREKEEKVFRFLPKRTICKT